MSSLKDELAEGPFISYLKNTSTAGPVWGLGPKRPDPALPLGAPWNREANRLEPQ